MLHLAAVFDFNIGDT